MPAMDVGDVLRETGRCSEAEPLYRRALALWEESLAKDHPYLADVLTGLGRCLVTLGRPGEAVTLLERALTIREGHKTMYPMEFGDTRFALAQALWGAGRKRAQARALAALAEKDFTTAGDEGEGSRKAVTAWLVEHR